MTTQNYKVLPQATTDLTQARLDLDTHGYALIENAMTSEQVGLLLTRLKEQAEAERQAGVAYEDGGPQQNWGDFTDDSGAIRKDAFRNETGGINQRVWMLVNKGQVFLELLGNEPVRALIDHALGNDYLLSSFTANIAKPGGAAMNLHTDQWWMPNPVRRDSSAIPVGSITREQSNWAEATAPELISPVVAVNVMWMLVDFTEENGGTRLVPGSHLWGIRPSDQSEQDIETIAATGKAGTAMIFDGRIWHGTGANVSRENRYGLLTTFCGPMLRSQENFIVGTDPKVLEAASDELLSLLGFKIWNAYGRVESPLAGYISRNEVGLSQMTPQ